MRKNKKLAIILCSTLIPVTITTTIATACVLTQKKNDEWFIPFEWKHQNTYNSFIEDPKTFRNSDKTSNIAHPFIRLVFNQKQSKWDQIDNFVKINSKENYFLLSTKGLEDTSQNGIYSKDKFEEQLKKVEYIDFLYVPQTIFKKNSDFFRSNFDINIDFNNNIIDSLFYKITTNVGYVLFPFSTSNTYHDIIDEIFWCRPDRFIGKPQCEFKLGDLMLTNTKNSDSKKYEIWLFQYTNWDESSIGLGFRLFNEEDGRRFLYSRANLFTFEY
ncbi:hypothetical protein [[Mycoplasma] anseris]|uniref:Lipoprotein n=1 Tax=[Mycoplasma] anseris TaxID=92400 RepID=A0A2Z4ND94_9BACT|nr:hypothetical protein [[Mycoplasma] anseris]AWX69476.1 hypothetical protein DP065_01785 [[Mycoplasma] anseris]